MAQLGQNLAQLKNNFNFGLAGAAAKQQPLRAKRNDAETVWKLFGHARTDPR